MREIQITTTMRYFTPPSDFQSLKSLTKASIGKNVAKMILIWRDIK